LFTGFHEENNNLYSHLSWNTSLKHHLLSPGFCHLICWGSTPWSVWEYFI